MDPSHLAKSFEGDVRCVRVVTHEETEVVALGVEAALILDLDPYTWSVTSGIRNAVIPGSQRLDQAQNPAQAMHWFIENLPRPSLIILRDAADQLSDSVNLRALRDLIEHLGTGRLGRSAVLMIDHLENVPASIGSQAVRYEIQSPDDSEIERIIRAVIVKAQQSRAVQAKVHPRFLSAFVQSLRGLSRRQVRSIVHECLSDATLADDDLSVVQRRKRDMLRDAGVLEFVDAPTSLDDIGGLTRLKAWLRQREVCFDDPTLPNPRGVLLLGVQGAGKSLASKAIATAWKRPLMRLDAGSLFNKYIGETERNLREALKQAQAMAPIVLWIDEIEKGFASASGTSNDGGTSRRMFGTLLTWMQEHDSPVFLVATANDIEALPPELLRKGRFDEIFFVDLPTPSVREVIFRIHLKKRGLDPAHFDLAHLASVTEGYSGAEIEQAVLACVVASRAAKTTPTTQSLAETASASPPLSVTMRERIEWLRDWAQGRCVPAD